MIEINDISKVFRTSEVETVALNHVNLEVKEGEFAAIMGPSGCGKSTLLNILGLLDNPTEGSYKLLGQEVGNLKEKERTRVRKGKLGFVFQSFNLIDELNVYESWYQSFRTSPDGGRYTKTNEYQSSCQTLSTTAFRWSATTCSHCPCCGY